MEYGELVHTEKDGPITYELYIEQDDMDVVGNAMASGDDAEDALVENEILERLDSGDIWAWAQVSVIARHEDVPELEGTDFLGGCSYRDTEDFIAPDGYWPDMKARAKEDLLTNIERMREALAKVTR